MKNTVHRFVYALIAAIHLGARFGIDPMTVAVLLAICYTILVILSN